MLIGARTAAWGGGDSGPQYPYEPDALWLDGIWNCGKGVAHSTTTTSWIDLCSGANLGVKGGALTATNYWTEDSYRITTSASNQIIKGTLGTNYAKFNGERMTFEMVLRNFDSTASSGLWGFRKTEGESFARAPNYCWFNSWGWTHIFRNDWNTNRVASGGSWSNIPSPLSDLYLAVALNGAGEYATVKSYINGYIDATTEATYVQAAFGSDYELSASAVVTLMNYYDNVWPNRSSIGELLAFRVHSRALTAAEIAANYAVDRERFNLT